MLKKVLIVAGAIFVGLLVIGALIGLSSDTVTTTPVSQASDTGAGEDTAQQSTAKIGDALEVSGSDTTLRVTVLAVQNQASSGNIYIMPDSGNKYVGVKLSIANTGSAVYSDSPSNCCTLIDAKSANWDATIGIVEPDLGSVKIAPGDKRVGWITFEVAKGSVPAKVQYTPDSGFSNETGEWVLSR